MRDRDRILATFKDRQRRRDQPPASNVTPNLAACRNTFCTDLPPALKATRSKLATIAFNLRKEKMFPPKYHRLVPKFYSTGKKRVPLHGIFTKAKLSVDS